MSSKFSFIFIKILIGIRRGFVLLNLYVFENNFVNYVWFVNGILKVMNLNYFNNVNIYICIFIFLLEVRVKCFLRCFKLGVRMN